MKKINGIIEKRDWDAACLQVITKASLGKSQSCKDLKEIHSKQKEQRLQISKKVCA